MRISLKLVIPNILFAAVAAAPGFCQGLPENLGQKVDVIIQEAYQSATEIFPCKLKAGGKPKILSWQTAEKCLNNAYERVDWAGISGRLREIKERGGIESVDFQSAIEASLTAHAVPFNGVFKVEEKDVLLPLSNSVLKFLPVDSLMGLPVTDKTGKKVGSFSGVYTFEKVGEFSGIMQRHSLFQYTDANGKMQSSSDRLLLDSFGVPWNDAAKQRGFRLPADRIDLRRAAGQREPINPKIPKKLS
ncbi:MAG TPA: hypothetical protein VMG30_20870 [Acidobacteriota bacterium]|nr:hypothetical protein [Acidobacteriota bacterium]